MAVIAPVALSPRHGGIVYVFTFVELAPDAWSAEVGWFEWDGRAWVGKRDTTPRDQLTQIEGQNYKAVPEWKHSEVDRRRREREAREASP